jgi:uracil-DNA glycosylase family 4
MSALPALSGCTACSRLSDYNAQIKTQYPDYHAAPVGNWGDRRCRVLVVGLAPGLHGAARTGKAFVGDASGHFLFQSLFRNGFATDPDPQKANLLGLRLTNVVKCLPPGNAPVAGEINKCALYLQHELATYVSPTARQPRVVLALGGTAHKALCRQYGLGGVRFAHGNVTQLAGGHFLVSSFHPSRLNVNTGRLTAQMFDRVLRQVRDLITPGNRSSRG